VDRGAGRKSVPDLPSSIFDPLFSIFYPRPCDWASAWASAEPLHRL